VVHHEEILVEQEAKGPEGYPVPDCVSTVVTLQETAPIQEVDI
jgi:hypothetical protein